MIRTLKKSDFDNLRMLRCEVRAIRLCKSRLGRFVAQLRELPQYDPRRTRARRTPKTPGRSGLVVGCSQLAAFREHVSRVYSLGWPRVKLMQFPLRPCL